jgi:hypothetical protein
VGKERKMWAIESILRAVKAVRERKMDLLKDSKMFSGPRATPKEIAVILVSRVWIFLLRD